MHVSVKVFHFVYLHCVRVVNTAERKGNKSVTVHQRYVQSEASSLSINVTQVLEFY